MIIEIDGKEYSLPDSYNEILLNNFIEYNTFAENNLPKEDDSEEVKAKFYFDYCCYFIPRETLKKANVIDQILPVFNHLWQFNQMPEMGNEPAELLILEKNAYKFVCNPEITSKPLESLTFEEFEEANAVLTALNKIKDLSYLSHLLAIFYRPVTKSIKNLFKERVEPYNSDKVEPRAELFKYSVDMATAWNCYFFLLNRMSNYAADTATYLIKELEKNHN